jgi:hypothetical protein
MDKTSPPQGKFTSSDSQIPETRFAVKWTYSWALKNSEIQTAVGSFILQ